MVSARGLKLRAKRRCGWLTYEVIDFVVLRGRCEGARLARQTGRDNICKTILLFANM